MANESPLNKYSYTDRCRQISGFGGGYEETCRKMVIAGMEWFQKNLNANPSYTEYENFYGYVKSNNKEFDSLQSAMNEASGNDCTGAMMQTCVNHVMFAFKNGWEAYIKEMEATK